MISTRAAPCRGGPVSRVNMTLSESFPRGQMLNLKSVSSKCKQAVGSQQKLLEGTADRREEK